MANQLITTGGSKVSLEQSAISGLTTAVTAGAFSATGQVTSTSLNYVKDYAIRGAFAGVIGDVTYQYLNNGITRDSDNKATGYSIGQAINNYGLNQTLRSGGIGAVMAPVGAKLVETSIDKFGPQVSLFGKMSQEDAAQYNKYWNQVQLGLTAEQRFNYQLYGDINGSVDFKINITKNHTVSSLGQPGTITRKIDNNGIIQDRIYGSNGKAFKDIDFYHTDGKGHTFPHTHIFDWTKNPPRLK